MWKNFEYNTIKINMLISGICKPVSLVIGYIYVPIVLNYLGIEKYGVWTTILTIFSWISFFDIGIGNGLRNKLTESLNRKQKEESKMLVSSAYFFISVIMCIATIILCFFAQFIDWNRVFGLSNCEENLSVVVGIGIFFVAMNFILSICKNVYYAMQNAANVSLMELIIQLTNLFGVLIARFFFDANIFIMTIIYGVSMTVVNVIFSVLLYTKNREISPSIRYINKSSGKKLTELGVQFFVIQICALVLFMTDSFIISYIFGASNVTPYSTVNKLFTTFSNLFVALITPIWSAVTKAKIEQNNEYIKYMINKLKLLMIPFGIGIIFMIIFFKNISRLWLGQELDYSYGLIAFGGVYCFLTIWCTTFANIANGLELMKSSMITSIIQAVINIPLSLFFAVSMGLGTTGVLVGTICAMTISAIVQPVCVYRALNHKI